jgi:hypothetical protein
MDFQTGPVLELIEVEDPQAYLDFVPKGMVPYCPGLSLVAAEGSETTLNDFARAFHHLDPYMLHLNYDGSPDPTGPGWNYLNFGTPVVADTFTWLTAYDQPKPVRQYDTAHPNGITSVIGLVFDLEIERLKELAQLVQQPFLEGAINIGGVQIWSRPCLRNFPTTVEKAFPLTAILLQAGNLDYFAEHDVRECSFGSRPAILIETNRLSWDLIVIGA